MLTLIYLILAGMGCFYIAASFLLGHGESGGHHGHDAGGDAGGDGDGGHGHDDAHSGEDGAWAKAASPLRSFLSPMAVAMLFAGVGGWGLVAQHAVGLGPSSLLLALPLGLLTAIGVVNATARLARSSQSPGDEIRMEQFFGAAGEVITPIPAGGVGEVAAIVGGQRYAGPAREIEGRAVPRGTLVTVVEKVGPTLVVTAGESKEESHE
jgi:membrane protein implicated in regulation of membrane protease activity